MFDLCPVLFLCLYFVELDDRILSVLRVVWRDFIDRHPEKVFVWNFQLVESDPWKLSDAFENAVDHLCVQLSGKHDHRGQFFILFTLAGEFVVYDLVKLRLNQNMEHDEKTLCICEKRKKFERMTFTKNSKIGFSWASLNDDSQIQKDQVGIRN